MVRSLENVKYCISPWVKGQTNTPDILFFFFFFTVGNEGHCSCTVPEQGSQLSVCFSIDATQGSSPCPLNCWGCSLGSMQMAETSLEKITLTHPKLKHFF